MRDRFTGDGDGHNLKQEKFGLDMWKNFFTVRRVKQ